jgi:Ca2+-binding RTX toxin-like protein
MLKATAVRANLVTSLVIFDSQVADLPLLYNALLPGSIAHTIQPHQDPIDYITNLLTQTGATKLAIVAHGQPGAIQIGNGVIDRAMLETRSGLLQEWGVDSIGIYACEVGVDRGFIKRLGELTGAKIAASTSKIGAGNWELDGGMELLSIDRLADYTSMLATFNGTQASDAANASGFTYLIGFTAGTDNDIALLTDGSGDAFYGGDGQDYVFAGNGDDYLYGDAGDDYLNGSDGKDYINGGSGSNTLTGGAGDDRIDANYMSDTVDGGTDNDFLLINTQSLNDAYTVEFTGANAGKLKINGTQTGTFTGIEQLGFGGWNGNDVINASLASLSSTSSGTAAGLNSGLYVNTRGGSDTVLGSASSDAIYGEAGNDFLYGNAGNDGIYGGSDFDIIFGQAGDDTILGEAGNDTIFGGIGLDTIDGGTGTDVIYGEEDNDTIGGGDATDFLFGQAGDDTLNGDAGNDYIFGGIGNDTITGGVGVDEIYGEADNDNIFGGDDTDFLFGQMGADFLFGQAGNDYLVGGDGADYLYGGIGIDTLNGENGNDILNGEDGDDFLYGNDGIDYLYGSLGNDFLDGGIGDDGISGEEGNDVLFGGDGNDSIKGNDGIDYLYGGNGNDTLSGGSGGDFLIGGAGSDTFKYFSMNEAGDVITDFTVAAISNGGDVLDFVFLFANLPTPVASSNVLSGGYISIAQSGTNTLVQIDQDGGGQNYGFVTIATLNNVNANALSVNSSSLFMV